MARMERSHRRKIWKPGNGRMRWKKLFLMTIFDPMKHKDCLQWALRQKKRIRAFSPGISSQKIVDKIIF